MKWNHNMEESSMSESAHKYGNSIVIAMEDILLFKECPRCAYFTYHPNIKVPRPQSRHIPDAVICLDFEVEIYNKQDKKTIYQVYVAVNEDNIESEILTKENISLVERVLSMRDFPLPDENCEYCKYYNALLDKIG